MHTPCLPSPPLPPRAFQLYFPTGAELQVHLVVPLFLFPPLSPPPPPTRERPTVTRTALDTPFSPRNVPFTLRAKALQKCAATQDRMNAFNDDTIHDNILLCLAHKDISSSPRQTARGGLRSLFLLYVKSLPCSTPLLYIQIQTNISTSRTTA